VLSRYRLERFRLRLVRERLRLLLEGLRLLLLPRLRLLPPGRFRLLLERLEVLFRLPDDFRRRVEAAFRAAVERDDFERDDFARDALPPLRPPFREALRVVFFPRPEPLFFPPPVSLFTVAQARRSASRREIPRFT
jgi:hypothetical protein